MSKNRIGAGLATVALAVAGVAASPCRAALLNTSAQITSGGPGGVGVLASDLRSGTTPLHSSATFTTFSNATATADTTAAFGVLGVRSLATMPSGLNFTIGGDNEARMADALLFFNASGQQITGGMFQILASIDGTISTVGSGSAFASLTVAASAGLGNAQFTTNGFHFAPVVASGFITSTAAQFSMTLDGNAQVGNPLGVEGGSTMDFSTTARIVAITATDANGNPITGLRVVAESGVSYPTSAVVPEPASLLLVGLGLAGSMTWARRRR